jgi:hypothetical protein
LLGGLEVLYRPCPSGTAATVSPELATGAAVSVLSQGADAVYLFNYFQDSHPGWPVPVYQNMLKNMASLDSLLKQPRRVGVTYRDITAPDEKYQSPLPATGKEFVFPIRLGPVPDSRRPCEVLIEFLPPQGATVPVPTVLFDGQPCEVRKDDATKEGVRTISFRVPATALGLPGTDVHEIKITGADQNSLTVRRVEVSLE